MMMVKMVMVNDDGDGDEGNDDDGDHYKVNHMIFNDTEIIQRK